MTTKPTVSWNEGRAVLRLAGELDAGAGWEALREGRGALGRGAKVLEIDLQDVGGFELGALSVFQRLRREAEQKSVALELRAPPPDLLRALEGLPELPPPADTDRGRSEGVLVHVGGWASSRFERALSAVDFVAESLLWLVWPPRGQKRLRPGLVAEQMILMGADAVGIVALISFLIGAIMGLQAAYQLRQFGADIYMADLVGVSMTRELGPLISAIIVSGRTGSAIAAELGTMMVSEEVDALKTLGVSPIGYLVAPRIVSLVLMLPCLALLADVCGVVGGLLVGVGLLELPVSAYWIETVYAVLLSDVMTGLVKASIFGLAIALTGCFRGLGVRGGAAGVGSAATSAVVTSIFLTILLDGLFTSLFFALGA